MVLDILKRTTEGQAVLDFYRMNTFLDIKNRKRVVNLVIKEVVERKVNKYTALFHDITRQLLELFPNEKYVRIFVNLSDILNFIPIYIFQETYFVAHSGSQSARGALYYRYSNYTRQLRKEGLLAYKKQKPRYCIK